MDTSKKPYLGNVLNNPKYKSNNKTTKDGEIAGELNIQFESAAHNDRLNRFNARQGHGYAAEQYNDMIDKLHGRDAVILGDDNAKNGADRMVDGKLIQTKYCQTAQASVDAAFSKKDGFYKYLDNNSKPMQVEVPSDQYEEAVKLMREKIIAGKVKGVTNPDDAEKIVRKGNVTYEQAVAVAKSGTIESLKFDAVHGTVIATSAFGISAIITFARSLWNGDEPSTALDKAVYTGIKMGGVAFITSVMTAQLTRTSMNNMLMGPSIEIVKLLPSSVRHAMVNAMREGAAIYGGAATNNLAKLVRGNIIASGVIVIVMSASDISNFFNGKISGKQLFKNVTTLASSLVAGNLGSYAGAVVGGSVGGPVGSKVGYVAGGMIAAAAGGSAASAVLDNFIEDDAIEMVRILNNRFVRLAQNYLLSEEELGLILEDLREELVKEKLLKMYASDDRESFADKLLTEVIEKTIRWRVHILLPPKEEFVKSLGRVLEMSASGVDVFQQLSLQKVDPVIIGKRLLGKDISKYAAGKAWYVTKQMNLALVQSEICLQGMSSNEKEYVARKNEIKRQTELFKSEFDSLVKEC